MHIITYKNGVSKNDNLKSKTANRLNILLYGRTRTCFLAIVNVTDVTRCYDIKKSSIMVKSRKKKKKTCETQTKWYFIFSDHGCLCFLIK